MNVNSLALWLEFHCLGYVIGIKKTFVFRIDWKKANKGRGANKKIIVRCFGFLQ